MSRCAGSRQRRAPSAISSGGAPRRRRPRLRCTSTKAAPGARRAGAASTSAPAAPRASSSTSASKRATASPSSGRRTRRGRCSTWPRSSSAAVSFGIYPQQTPEQVRYLLEHSEAKVVYVERREPSSGPCSPPRRASRGLTAIVPWEARARCRRRRRGDPRVASPEALDGAPMEEDEVERRLAAIASRRHGDPRLHLGHDRAAEGRADGQATVTSLLAARRGARPGTTRAICRSTSCPWPTRRSGSSASSRASTAASPPPTRARWRRCSRISPSVRPTMFGAVPRIFEKAYAKMQGELEKKPPAVQKLFAWALSVGKRVHRARARERAGAARAPPPARGRRPPRLPTRARRVRRAGRASSSPAPRRSRCPSSSSSGPRACRSTRCTA